MNSPFANIFLALQEHITALVPAIIYIDMDYGQLEAKERPAVAFPCCLIDFPNWNFTDLSNLVQQAEGGISFKLATNPYSSSSSITPETYKEDAISILDLEFALYQALEGWKPVSKGEPLGRINTVSDNRRTGLKVRTTTFTHSFQDYSAKRQTTTIPTPAANITGTMH